MVGKKIREWFNDWYAEWLGGTLKIVFSPDVILCGWLGSKHHLTNKVNADRAMTWRWGVGEGTERWVKLPCRSMRLSQVYMLRKISRYRDGCHLRHIFGVGRSVSVSLLFLIVCLRVVWTFMMHVFTFILQNVNSMTLWSLTMTPYNSQARVMLTLNIIQL